MTDATGNTAALLKDVTGASSQATNNVSDFIGTLADIGGAVGTAGSVISLVAGFMGIDGLSPDDMLNAISAEIAAAFHQWNLDWAAADILGRNQDINDLIFAPGAAYEYLQGLKEYVRLLNEDPPQLTEGVAAEYISNCMGTCNGFAPLNDYIWNLVYDWCVFFSDAGTYFTFDLSWQKTRHDPPGYISYELALADVGYGMQPPPANPEGTVFAYTYSLPTYLTAVSVFLSVGLALDPEFLSDWQESLAGLASDLQSKHDIIFNGIMPLSPGYWTMDSITPQQIAAGVTGMRSIWRVQAASPGLLKTRQGPALPQDGGAIIEYGAIETFSGYSAIESNYIVTTGPSPADEAIPFNKLQLRVLQKKKEVYVGVGLLRTWNTIDQLRQLAGQAPLPRPSFVDWSFRRDIIPTLKATPSTGSLSGWSAREIASLIEVPLPRDTPVQSGKVSFRQLLDPIPTPHPPRPPNSLLLSELNLVF